MAAIERSDEANVRILTMNRPEVRNAANLRMLEEMDSELTKAREDGVRCLVLEGAGVDFGTGGDVAQVVGDPRTPYNPERTLALYRATARALYTLPCPTIAIVQGNALAIHLDWALACDLRFAATGAKFRAGFDRFASSTESLTHLLLPRLLGIDRAKSFFYRGEVWSGEQAHRAGLVTEVLPAETLRSEALAAARDIAIGPTSAFAAGKELMDRSFERTLDENLAAGAAAELACQKSEDAAEAMQALEEGRTPVFRGR